MIIMMMVMMVAHASTLPDLAECRLRPPRPVLLFPPLLTHLYPFEVE